MYLFPQLNVCMTNTDGDDFDELLFGLLAMMREGNNNGGDFDADSESHRGQSEA